MLVKVQVTINAAALKKFQKNCTVYLSIHFSVEERLPSIPLQIQTDPGAPILFHG